VLIALVMISTTADVMSRTLLGRGIQGVVDINGLLLVPISFLGLAYAQRQGMHISVSGIINRTPRRLGDLMKRVGLFVSVITIGWIFFEAAGKMIESYSSNETVFGLIRLRVWPYRAVLA